MLDGASRLRVLLDVTLPVIARPLAAVGLLVLVMCWNEYVYAAYLSASDAQTLPPFLVGQMSIREQQAGSDPDEVSRLAAVAVLMVAPLVPVALWVTRIFAVPRR
jgi:multiple sugar transport system permease protein